MIQTKSLAIAEVTSGRFVLQKEEKMKKLFSFVSKISDFISKFSDVAWTIIILILFIIIFIFILIGIMKC